MPGYSNKNKGAGHIPNFASEKGEEPQWLTSSEQGYIPNFAPPPPNSAAIQRALVTEKSMGATKPVVDTQPGVGTYVRDAATQPNFAAVRRDHPEGISTAIRNSAKAQGARGRGHIPGFVSAAGVNWDTTKVANERERAGKRAAQDWTLTRSQITDQVKTTENFTKVAAAAMAAEIEDTMIMAGLKGGDTGGVYFRGAMGGLKPGSYKALLKDKDKAEKHDQWITLSDEEFNEKYFQNKEVSAEKVEAMKRGMEEATKKYQEFANNISKNTDRAHKQKFAKFGSKRFKNLPHSGSAGIWSRAGNWASVQGDNISWGPVELAALDVWQNWVAGARDSLQGVKGIKSVVEVLKEKWGDPGEDLMLKQFKSRFARSESGGTGTQANPVLDTAGGINADTWRQLYAQLPYGLNATNKAQDTWARNVDMAANALHKDLFQGEAAVTEFFGQFPLKVAQQSLQGINKILGGVTNALPGTGGDQLLDITPEKVGLLERSFSPLKKSGRIAGIDHQKHEFAIKWAQRQENLKQDPGDDWDESLVAPDITKAPIGYDLGERLAEGAQGLTDIHLYKNFKPSKLLKFGDKYQLAEAGRTTGGDSMIEKSRQIYGISKWASSPIWENKPIDAGMDELAWTPNGVDFLSQDFMAREELQPYVEKLLTGERRLLLPSPELILDKFGAEKVGGIEVSKKGIAGAEDIEPVKAYSPKLQSLSDLRAAKQKLNAHIAEMQMRIEKTTENMGKDFLIDPTTTEPMYANLRQKYISAQAAYTEQLGLVDKNITNFEGWEGKITGGPGLRGLFESFTFPSPYTFEPKEEQGANLLGGTNFDALMGPPQREQASFSLANTVPETREAKFWDALEAQQLDATAAQKVLSEFWPTFNPREAINALRAHVGLEGEDGVREELSADAFSERFKGKAGDLENRLTANLNKKIMRKDDLERYELGKYVGGQLSGRKRDSVGKPVKVDGKWKAVQGPAQLGAAQTAVDPEKIKDLADKFREKEGKKEGRPLTDAAGQDVGAQKPPEIQEKLEAMKDREKEGLLHLRNKMYAALLEVPLEAQQRPEGTYIDFLRNAEAALFENTAREKEILERNNLKYTDGINRFNKRIATDKERGRSPSKSDADKLASYEALRAKTVEILALKEKIVTDPYSLERKQALSGLISSRPTGVWSEIGGHGKEETIKEGSTVIGRIRKGAPKIFDAFLEGKGVKFPESLYGGKEKGDELSGEAYLEAMDFKTFAPDRTLYQKYAWMANVPGVNPGGKKFLDMFASLSYEQMMANWIEPGWFEKQTAITPDWMSDSATDQKILKLKEILIGGGVNPMLFEKGGAADITGLGKDDELNKGDIDADPQLEAQRKTFAEVVKAVGLAVYTPSSSPTKIETSSPSLAPATKEVSRLENDQRERLSDEVTELMWIPSVGLIQQQLKMMTPKGTAVAAVGESDAEAETRVRIAQRRKQLRQELAFSPDRKTNDELQEHAQAQIAEIAKQGFMGGRVSEKTYTAGNRRRRFEESGLPSPYLGKDDDPLASEFALVDVKGRRGHELKDKKVSYHTVDDEQMGDIGWSGSTNVLTDDKFRVAVESGPLALFDVNPIGVLDEEGGSGARLPRDHKNRVAEAEQKLKLHKEAQKTLGTFAQEYVGKATTKGKTFETAFGETVTSPDEFSPDAARALIDFDRGKKIEKQAADAMELGLVSEWKGNEFEPESQEKEYLESLKGSRTTELTNLELALLQHYPKAIGKSWKIATTLTPPNLIEEAVELAKVGALLSGDIFPQWPNIYEQARELKGGPALDDLDWGIGVENIKKALEIGRLKREANEELERREAQGPRGAALGFVPNFNRVAGEMTAAREAGYKSPVKPSEVKSINIPGEGRTTYNTQEKVMSAPGVKQPFIVPPKDSRAAKSYGHEVQKKFGFSPYTKRAAEGFVPNFATGGILDTTGFDSGVKTFEDAVTQFRSLIDGAQISSSIDTTDLDASIGDLKQVIGEGVSANFQLEGVQELEGVIDNLRTVFEGGVNGTIDFSDTLNVAVDVNVQELKAAMTNALQNVVKQYFDAQAPNIQAQVQEEINKLWGGLA